jgi:biotin transport system substrate-specific component
MNTATLPASRLSSQLKWIALNAVQIGSFTALTALAAQVRIPLPGTPVPVTAQSLVVILAGAILGSKRGALSQLLLIALGGFGLAVFSQKAPGYQVILGPTGGYILGFVFAAYVAGSITENAGKLSFARKNFYLFLASLFIFIPGVVWLSTFTGKNLWIATQLGFAPFLPGDILKTVLAATILTGVEIIRGQYTKYTK